MTKEVKKNCEESLGVSFGERLRSFRRLKGLTQQQLGDMIGASKRAVCSYELDQREPPAHMLPLIAQNLNVSIDDLLGHNANVIKPQKLKRKLMRRFVMIDKLPENKQRAILQVLDMALKTNG